jgi:lipid-A-disaccharide synthase
MGFTGVLRQLPLLLRAFTSYLRLLRDDPPDLVVLVDYPGLHVVMAKAAKRRKVPVLHYVAPQYWAWGPWRMRATARAVDATLTILPFETAFFRRFRVPAAYIGHPLLDELAAHPPDAAPCDAARSRRSCCCRAAGAPRSTQNLPACCASRGAARARSLDARRAAAQGRRRTAARTSARGRRCRFVEHHEGPLAPWLAGARLVLAKSGTGRSRPCLHGSPTVVVYQLRGALSTLGYHNILSVPWIAAANLVAGRAVVPEFCFHHAGGWDDVLAAARSLWQAGPEREATRSGLAEVRQRLGAAGATARVAAIVGAFLVPEARA